MSLTNNINYLQASGFRFVADKRRFANLSFFAQSVNHPSISTNAAEVAYGKFASVPQVGDKFTYGALTATVLIDEDMKSYLEILNWMKHNVDKEDLGPNSVNSSFSDLTLHILSSKNNINKTIIYRNAIPTDLGEINMESNQDGTQVMVCPVTFRYTEFVIT